MALWALALWALKAYAGQDDDTPNAFEALTKSVRTEKVLLVKGSLAKKARFHLTSAANVTSRLKIHHPLAP